MLRCSTLWWRLFAGVTHPEGDKDDAKVTRVVAVTMMWNWRNVNCIMWKVLGVDASLWRREDCLWICSNTPIVIY